MPARKLIPIGTRFARLKVIAQIHACSRSNSKCLCDCGNEVTIQNSDLRRGFVKSCGCFKIEATIARSYKHGHSKRGQRNNSYKSWADMIQRVTNPNNKGYSNYGGRGIMICERWFNFKNFFEDMGERPDGMTLERIEVNGDYQPSNCRWATRQEQSENKTDSRIVTAFGQTGCIKSICRKHGIRYDTVAYRIRKGLSIEQALTLPPKIGQRLKDKACIA